MALDDYGALLRSGAASVPDYAAQEAQKQLMQMRGKELELQTQKAQQQIDEGKSFQNDLDYVLAHPSAQAYSQLILRHPEKAQEIKTAHTMLDDSRQQGDLTQMGEIYSAAANGKFDLAGQLLQRRIDADKAVDGTADPHDEAVLAALKSGDPVQQKAAMGMIGVGLASITGPDKFESTLGQLTKGSQPEIRSVEMGGSVAERDPATGAWKETYRNPYFKDADGNIGMWEGGDPASGSGGQATDLPPAQAEVATTLASALPAPVVAGFLGNFHAEGGYSGAKGDGGTAHGIAQLRGERVANFERVIGKPVAEATPAEQANFTLWEMRNPEAAGMTVAQRDQIMNAKTPAQAAALIDQFYERSSGEHRQKRMEAADRFAGGGAAGGAQGRGYKIISQKTKDAPSGFRWNASGNLEAIPGGPANEEEALDPQTTTFYAQQILAGGQMPTLGMGKAAAEARRAIMKQVAKMAGGEGMTGADLATQIAHYKAGQQQLNNLEKMAGNVEQAEQTALANGQQFIDRSAELPGQTQYPGLNSIVQFGQRHAPVAGHDTVVAMDAAWQTFTTEYAKVVAGSPSGAGVLSDSARHEAQATMKGNYSLSQKKAAFKQMQADMANRMAAIHKTIDKGYRDLTKRRGSDRGSGADDGGTLPKGAKIIGTHQGKRVIQLANGKRMVEQ